MSLPDVCSEPHLQLSRQPTELVSVVRQRIHQRMVKTRKLCYRKDDRAMPPYDLYMDALKFSGLPDYAHRYYSQHFFMGFCSDRSYECSYKI